MKFPLGRGSKLIRLSHGPVCYTIEEPTSRSSSPPFSSSSSSSDIDGDDDDEEEEEKEEKPLVVLVHGFVGSSAYFRFLSEELTKSGRRVRKRMLSSSLLLSLYLSPLCALSRTTRYPINQSKKSINPINQFDQSNQSIQSGQSRYSASITTDEATASTQALPTHQASSWGRSPNSLPH